MIGSDNYISSRVTSFSQAVMQELNCFYETSQLYDTVLHSSDGRIFKAHRIVLMASSLPMKTFFLTMPENQEIVSLLFDIKGTIIKYLLDYIYTGRCIMSEDIIGELLLVSHKWKVSGLNSMCCNYLIQSMTPENCFKFYEIGLSYFCPIQKKKAWRYITHNFIHFYQSSNDYENMKLITLINLLSDDHLNVHSEHFVIDAISKWINHEAEERQKWSPILMKCVRFSLADDKRFRTSNNLNNNFSGSVNGTTSGRRIYTSDNSCVINSYYPTNCRPRIPLTVLFAIGGCTDSALTNLIETYDVRTNQWFVSDKGGRPKANHGTAVVDNKIYIIGGYSDENLSRTVECFDPETRLWSNKASMFHLRCNVCVCSHGGLIYAIGGYDGFHTLSSAEKYNPDNDTWELITPMKYSRSSAAATVLHDKIYVAGGKDDFVVHNSVEEYDTKTGIWREIVPMSVPRCGLSLVTLNESLYALGGTDGITAFKSCEKINPVNETAWSRIPDMSAYKCHFAAVVLEGIIYTVGGYNGILTLSLNECFDEELNKWFCSSPMEVSRTGLSCCLCSGLKNVRSYTAHSTIEIDGPAKKRCRYR